MCRLSDAIEDQKNAHRYRHYLKSGDCVAGNYRIFGFTGASPVERPTDVTRYLIAGHQSGHQSDRTSRQVRKPEKFSLDSDFSSENDEIETAAAAASNSNSNNNGKKKPKKPTTGKLQFTTCFFLTAIIDSLFRMLKWYKARRNRLTGTQSSKSPSINLHDLADRKSLDRLHLPSTVRERYITNY